MERKDGNYQGRLEKTFYGVERQTKTLGIGEVIKVSNMDEEENPPGRGKGIKSPFLVLLKRNCTGQS